MAQNVQYVLQTCILAFLLIKGTSLSTGNVPQCKIILSDNYDTCRAKTHKSYHTSRKGYSKNRISRVNLKLYNITIKECKPQAICGNVFKILRLTTQIFNQKMLSDISDMLYRCCSKCAKYYLDDTHYDLRHINEIRLHSSDFVFPVTAHSAEVTALYGFHYVPVYEYPSAYYITQRRSEREMAIDLIISCFRMWPLLIVCVLLSLISGFIIWFIERGRNVNEFHQRFHFGLLDGFWWSWITMTTVGYGDKAPKSTSGRIFTIIWVTVGMTLFSLCTASVTSAMLSVQALPDTKLSGKTVGILRHQFQDSIIVNDQGGIAKTVECNAGLTCGVMDLITLLKRKKIDGFLINKAEYHYVANEIYSNSTLQPAYERMIYNMHLFRTEKRFLGETPVTGMLVRNRTSYDFFRTYFKHNWMQMQGCYGVNINKKDIASLEGPQDDNYSPFDGLLRPLLFTSFGVLLTLVCFGGFCEIRRMTKERNLAARNKCRTSTVTDTGLTSDFVDF